eukprot:scaffold59036_cov62-Phaeocystis_antarctica.AAC.2
MGCCGSKEKSDSERSDSSLEGGRACEVAAPDPVLLLIKRVMQAAGRERPLTPAERLTMRAALPEHLRLGVTLAGMRELLKQLPSDAVEQVNAKIPLTDAGELKFPENDVENGYVNQFH